MWLLPVRSIRQILVLALWVMIHVMASGQSEPVSVLTVNNGLKSGYIHSGLFDSRGFLWLGSSDGLIRYDGRNVVEANAGLSDSLALQSRAVYLMTEDRRGRIFILGDQGLEVFLPDQNRFKMIYHHIPGQPSFANFWIDEELHTGFISELLQYDIVPFDLDQLTIYTDRKTTPAPILTVLDGFWHLRNLGDGLQPVKWFTNDLQQHNINQYHSSTGPIHALNAEGKNIWTGFHHLGFYRFAYGKEAPEWKPFALNDIDIPETTRMYYYDYNDTLGVAYAEGFGLLSFDKRDGKIARTWDMRKNTSLNRWTAGQILCKDKVGRLWFTIMPYGVFVLDPLSPRFQVLRNENDKSLLYNGLLRSMACDTSGNLWLGFHDGMIQALDPSLTREIYRYTYHQQNAATALNSITSLTLHPQGHILANNHISFLQGTHGYRPVSSVTYPVEKFHSPTFNTISRPEHIAYLCDTSGVTCTYTIESADQKEYFIENVNYEFVPLSFMPQQDLILSNVGKVLVVYSMSDNDTLIRSQLPIDMEVKSIYQEPGADSVWITTTDGLYTLQLGRRVLHKINTSEWPNQTLYGIVPDRRGTFWISSNGGLIRFDPLTRQWKRFDYRDGLQSNEFNTNCFARMKDGSIAFGGPEGINVFDPAYFDAKDVPFYVYGIEVRIQDTLLSVFNPFDVHASFVMRPSDKALEIDYTSTLFFDREDIHYYVRLEGADKDWVDMGDKEMARYINLKPGRYTFQLRAVNADGRASANIFEASVRVIPAFYQTVWFLLVCVFSAVSLVYAFYRYRINQMRHLEAIRNRISHDLHDDIGSTLGSISIYSEVAKHSDAAKQPIVLDKIGEASREMIEKLNDIVWSINPENDSLDKLESRMRGYASMVLQPKGIQCNVTSEGATQDLAMDMDQRRNMFLIFKEAVYNAAKYAQCQSVDISLSYFGGKLSMSIMDDGVGFDPDRNVAYNGNGLKSMRERALAIKAELLIESSPGAGTKISLRV